MKRSKFGLDHHPEILFSVKYETIAIATKVYFLAVSLVTKNSTFRELPGKWPERNRKREREREQRICEQSCIETDERACKERVDREPNEK